MTNVEKSERWFHTQRKPFSLISEEFRVIQTKLTYTKRNDPLKTILVTSVGRGVGKTTVATNLAATYSKGGRNVLLLDANSRNPKLHDIYDLPNIEGFSDIIIHNNSIDSVTQEVDRFKIITHGLGDVEGFIKPDKISRLIKNLENKFDFVVIDSPSMDIADTQVLASEVDGVLLVVKPETSKKETALKARNQIQDGNIELLGVVFSRFKDNLSGLKYIRHQLRQMFSTISGGIRRSLSRRPSGEENGPEVLEKSPQTETVSVYEVKYPDLLEAYEQNLGTTAGSRYQAVRLLKLGNEVSEIVEITECDSIDLMAWESTYDEYGVEALGEENGSGTKITQLQKDEIKARLQAMTPSEVLGNDANKFNSDFWTLTDLTKAVKMWYGVEYQSRQFYYEIFRYADLVYSGAERGYKLKEPSQNHEEMDS
jgi:capsular exopolysaccharide synthesis family protein